MADANCNITPERSSSLHDAILLRADQGAVLVNREARNSRGIKKFKCCNEQRKRPDDEEPSLAPLLAPHRVEEIHCSGLDT